MGASRRPSTTPNNQRPASKGPSRRGSVTYITQENNADSPRLSRLDRNSRSVSQPRGKRDSSVSSAYGGVDMTGNRLSASNRYRGSRESLQSGMTYSARKNSSSTLHNDNDYYYGGSMRDL